MPPDEERNATFRHTRAEVVTKLDGRYLLYYSWPGLADEAAGTDSDEAPQVSREQPRGPDQQPWSPQGGPPDE